MLRCLVITISLNGSASKVSLALYLTEDSVENHATDRNVDRTHERKVSSASFRFVGWEATVLSSTSV